MMFQTCMTFFYLWGTKRNLNENDTLNSKKDKKVFNLLKLNSLNQLYILNEKSNFSATHLLLWRV